MGRCRTLVRRVRSLVIQISVHSVRVSTADADGDGNQSVGAGGAQVSPRKVMGAPTRQDVIRNLVSV